MRQKGLKRLRDRFISMKNYSKSNALTIGLGGVSKGGGIAIHETISKSCSLQSWCLQKRLENNPIALVPTMGFLHAGHVSLIRKARKAAGPTGIVIVTLYVNPTQFGQGEDFDAYPRDLKRDLAICRSEGVNAVFTPSHGSMYAHPTAPTSMKPFSRGNGRVSNAHRISGGSRRSFPNYSC